jgi:hypothetical protein
VLGEGWDGFPLEKVLGSNCVELRLRQRHAAAIFLLDLRPVQGRANEKSPLRRIFEGRLLLRICQQTRAQSEAREGL